MLAVVAACAAANRPAYCAAPVNDDALVFTSSRVVGGFALDDAVNTALDVSASSVQSLAFEEDPYGTVMTLMVVDGALWTLRLDKHSIRADGFQVLVQADESGDLTPVDPPESVTYRGTVLEIPGSRIAGSFVNGRLTATIATPDGWYGVQPVSELGFAVGDDLHVVHRAADFLNTGDYRCGVTDEPLVIEGAVPGEGGTAGTGLKKTDIAADAGFSFFQQNGSSVALTVNDIENIINSVALKYEVAAIGITYEITTIVVRTNSNDPYTSSNPVTLLCQFRSTWNSSPESSIQRDVAHLFTGINLSGDIIGIAWLGVVCNVAFTDCGVFGNLAYGLAQSRFTTNFNFRVGLSAHEIGHNWNAGHCNNCVSCGSCCRIMCSGLGGCTGIVTSFGCMAISQINAFKNTRTCLSDLADPISPPFFDDFPSSTINSTKWSYNKGGFGSTSALGEPSPSRSLNLNAIGSGQYQDDEVRSNFILLAGQSNLFLSYHTEHLNVESGEELVVEYWANFGDWVEINRVTSDGVNQTTFEPHSHALPGNAYHNKFRIRFRTEVNQSNDNWYIDDVEVATIDVLNILAQPVDATVCEGDAASFTVVADGTPPIEFQWRKNGVDIAGETSSTLVFDPALPADEGTYDCLVSNAAGTVTTDSANLSVVTQADCDDGVFCTGAEFCNGGVCASGSDPCPPAETCFEESQMCSFLAILEQPVSSTVCDGDAASFSIVAESTLPLEYQWKKDGLDVPGATDPTLIIDPAAPPDAGSYTCVVSNAAESVESAAAALTVVTAVDCDDGLFCNGAESCNGGVCGSGSDPCPPDETCFEESQMCSSLAILKQPVSATVCDGDAASFSIVAEGTPPIGYQWKKDGLDVPGATDPTLIIDPAAPPDAGSYTCVVSNAAQSVESVAAALTVVTTVDCDDGLFCNGAEVCSAGACILGSDPCPGEVCIEIGQVCEPIDALMSCVLGSPLALPSASVPLEIFLDDIDDLRAYQTSIQIQKLSGIGEITIACPDGVLVDLDRPDWVFAGETGVISAADCIVLRLGAALIVGGIDVPPSPHYAGTFTLDVSADAEPGTLFAISILPEDDSFLRNSNSGQIQFNIGPPCMLTITDEPCEGPSVSAIGPRYLEIIPSPGDLPIAFHVTSVDEPCVDQYVDFDPDPDAAALGVVRLVDVPVFLTPAEWGVVRLSDSEIIPGNNYSVSTDCNGVETATASATTWEWCDVNNSGPPTDFDDILCILEGFADNFTNCGFFAVDVLGFVTNAKIDFDDILTSLEAFAGQAYPGAGPCDPAPIFEDPERQPGPSRTSRAVITPIIREPSVEAGDRIVVDVFIAGAADLRAYQVAVDAFALNNERLSVRDVVIDTARRDYAFSSRASLPATDAVGSRLGSVLIEGAVDVAGPRYLGTFVFDTAGVVAGDAVQVEVRVGEDSFLRDASADSIDFSVGGPMIVTID